MTPRVMVLTPKRTLMADSREEAELIRLALLDGGTPEEDIVLAEQQHLFDDAWS